METPETNDALGGTSVDLDIAADAVSNALLLGPAPDDPSNAGKARSFSEPRDHSFDVGSKGNGTMTGGATDDAEGDAAKPDARKGKVRKSDVGFEDLGSDNVASAPSTNGSVPSPQGAHENEGTAPAKKKRKAHGQSVRFFLFPYGQLE